ncbi:hypothetical protein E2562_020159 [Oryza meyeriana var. granulata]|uniref:Uncharacterized protein n=1 Tax=Oryza meyeriana var. granulata TaxID=110450 RepID=A0A6G1BMB8_9ORYZ|nr:hypothetical protein E2562_020159 [Oryza meyeriana var. granulata]
MALFLHVPMVSAFALPTSHRGGRRGIGAAVPRVPLLHIPILQRSCCRGRLPYHRSHTPSTVGVTRGAPQRPGRRRQVQIPTAVIFHRGSKDRRQGVCNGCRQDWQIGGRQAAACV